MTAAILVAGANLPHLSCSPGPGQPSQVKSLEKIMFNIKNLNY